LHVDRICGTEEPAKKNSHTHEKKKKKAEGFALASASFSRGRKKKSLVWQAALKKKGKRSHRKREFAISRKGEPAVKSLIPGGKTPPGEGGKEKKKKNKEREEINFPGPKEGGGKRKGAGLQDDPSPHQKKKNISPAHCKGEKNGFIRIQTLQKGSNLISPASDREKTASAMKKINSY